MTFGLSLVLSGAALWFGLSFLAAVVIVPLALVIASREAGAAVLTASAELRGVVMDGLDGHQDLVALGRRFDLAPPSATATS